MTKITMFRGDNRDQPFLIKYKTSGNPVDLTASEIRFTVRRFEFDSDFTFQYKNPAAGGSDIEMSDPANGKFIVHLKPAETSLVEGNQRYWYDVEIIIGGKTTTVVKDRILFKQDISY